MGPARASGEANLKCGDRGSIDPFVEFGILDAPGLGGEPNMLVAVAVVIDGRTFGRGVEDTQANHGRSSYCFIVLVTRGHGPMLCPTARPLASSDTPEGATSDRAGRLKCAPGGFEPPDLRLRIRCSTN